MHNRDNRLILRVVVKIMLLISLVFSLYIFIASFLQSDEENETLLIDVSSIAPGNAAYFKAGRRPVVVVNKSERPGVAEAADFLVVYAQDTVYGCEVRLDILAKKLKALCADVEYDLDGRLVKGTQNHENLSSPPYQWKDQQHLLVHIE